MLRGYNGSRCPPPSLVLQSATSCVLPAYGASHVVCTRPPRLSVSLLRIQVSPKYPQHHFLPPPSLLLKSNLLACFGPILSFPFSLQTPFQPVGLGGASLIIQLDLLILTFLFPLMSELLREMSPWAGCTSSPLTTVIYYTIHSFFININTCSQHRTQKVPKGTQ